MYDYMCQERKREGTVRAWVEKFKKALDKAYRVVRGVKR